MNVWQCIFRKPFFFSQLSNNSIGMRNRDTMVAKRPITKMEQEQATEEEKTSTTQNTCSCQNNQHAN